MQEGSAGDERNPGAALLLFLSPCGSIMSLCGNFVSLCATPYVPVVVLCLFMVVSCLWGGSESLRTFVSLSGHYVSLYRHTMDFKQTLCAP